MNFIVFACRYQEVAWSSCGASAGDQKSGPEVQCEADVGKVGIFTEQWGSGCCWVGCKGEGSRQEL